jgi:hypothetical protein
LFLVRSGTDVSCSVDAPTKGPAAFDCLIDPESDPLDPTFIVRMTCPAGQVAIQSGVVAPVSTTDKGYITGVQVAGPVASFYVDVNVPSPADFAAMSASVTCAPLTYTPAPAFLLRQAGSDYAKLTPAEREALRRQILRKREREAADAAAAAAKAAASARLRAPPPPPAPPARAPAPARAPTGGGGKG